VPLKSEAKHGCRKMYEVQHFVEWLFSSSSVREIARQHSFVSFPEMPQLLAELRKMTCNGTLVSEMKFSSDAHSHMSTGKDGGMGNYMESLTFAGSSQQKSLQEALTAQHFLEHGT